MKTERIILAFLMSCLLPLALHSTSFSAAKVGKQSAEQKATAKEIMVEEDVSEGHPQIEEGFTCNDCHEITIDAKTTATQAWLTQDYLTWNEGEGAMSKEAVWQEIVKVLGGKKEKKTYVLGTCLNNIPLTTTADFSLDPEKKVLYALHEKGTEKLVHLKRNPRVSLNWHVPFKDFNNFLCVQILGHSELLDGSNPEFEKTLLEVIEYEYGAKIRKMDLKQFRENLKQVMVMNKVTIDRATIANISFRQNGYRPYQRWTRE